MTPGFLCCILGKPNTSMNVSELARQLRIHPSKLLQVLPEFGFDIGAKAVKIDDRVAQQIQKEWRRIKFVLERREQEEREKQKQLEKEMRKQSGATVTVPATISVKELSEVLQLPVNKLIVELMKNGILATQNESIDRDTATIIATDLGFTVTEAQTETVVADSEHVENLETALSQNATVPRPPVIVIMGHVDHGKTKLLDTIRSTNVVAGEAGGITQHIGAYQTTWTNPKSKQKSFLTFIDTPGHEAFTVMRSRGAKVADIAVLVVAADDSVKPQTVEAINIIKAAQLPFVVAINKIDKPGADAKRVRTDLAQHNILADDWGGEVPVVEISAKENKNIDKLLDTLLLVAELNNDKIKADPKRAAAGTVIEAHVDKGAGPVATILVQTGTLHANDPLVVNGEIYGKVRSLKDYRGQMVTEAPPSMPVRILGFKIAPQVGDVLDVGRQGNAGHVDIRSKKSQQTGAEKITITQNQTEEEDEPKRTLNLVIKADTLGSLEAIIGSIEAIKHDEVGIKIIGKGLGNITADDVTRAQTAAGMVLAFNVQPMSLAQEMIMTHSVPFYQFSIIYDLLDKIKIELEKLLSPELITTEFGNLKVLAIFRSEKNHQILGGRVESGKLVKDSKVRVKRGGEIIGLGKVTEVQSGKQVVNEIPSGSEGGLMYEGKLKVEVGDILEAYKEEKKDKKLILS